MNSSLPNTEAVQNQEPNEESWRNEVSSRLDSYRAKRKRNLAGQFSIRFNEDGEPAAAVKRRLREREPAVALPESEVPFEPAVATAEPEPVVMAAEMAPPVEEPVTVQESPVQQAVESQPPGPGVPFRRKIVMGPNVIEFPRLFSPDFSESIAEPVGPASPRILDAPEIAEPLLDSPMLDGLRLEDRRQETKPSRLELPLQVAFLRPRVYAAIIDLVTVLAGCSLALTIAYSMIGQLEWTKPLVGSVLALQFVFWSIYQYIFLVYGGRTPGMQMARVFLRTFEGHAPTRRERRRRVLGLLLSCMSLSLGFLWAFFDEDTLCWHDRISGTYSTQGN